MMILAGNNMTDFADMDSGNNTVIIGEQINLAIDLGSLPDSMTNQVSYQWHLPSDNFQSFDPTASSDPEEDFQSDDYQGDGMTFYLTTPNGNDEVSCDITIQGVTITVYGYLNVVGPTVNMTAEYQTGIEILNGSHNNATVQLGPEGNSQGIVFNSSDLQNPRGFNGYTIFAQIVSSSTATSGSHNVFGDPISNKLDTAFPYPGSLPNFSVVDDPDFPLEGLYSPFAWKESFKMYLLFLPNTPNANWVPLYETDWGWGGTTVKDSSGNWSLQSSPNHGTPTITQQSSELALNWSGVAEGQSSGLPQPAPAPTPSPAPK